MPAKRREKLTFRSDQSGSLVEAIKQASGRGGVVNEWMSRLTAQQRRQLTNVGRKLDVRFLAEKIDLMQDTLVQILERRKETPSTLLQRNLWSSFDAIAMHFDAVGFTPLIQTTAARIATKVRLDDPKLVAFETQLSSIVLDGDARMSSLGIEPIEFEEVLHYAEAHKRKSCGLPKMARKSFTMKGAVAEFCGRPDQMLDVIIHSPQAAKVVIIVVLLVANIAAAVLGLLSVIGFLLGVVVAVVTVIVIVIIGGCGC